jgi:hypothetical protein
MPKASVGRVILAVVVGWVTNAFLVGVTEVLLWKSMRGMGGKLPGKYYMIDLICQCCFTVVGGYLCCVIARPSRRVAMRSLMALGILIGGLSLPSSWAREPHWYRIALLAVWIPCIWIGWTLHSQRASAEQRSLSKPSDSASRALPVASSDQKKGQLKSLSETDTI